MHARKYWLRHAPTAAGHIRVDAGAARALSGGRVSLLPGGVLGADGEFHRGDLVEIVDAALWLGWLYPAPSHNAFSSARPVP